MPPTSTILGRTRAVTWALVATILVEIVSVGAILGELSLMLDARAGRTVDLARAHASDARMNTIANLSLVVFLATLIAWCMWQHRAQRNVHALGRGALRYSPAWAVGCWFVPIVNLWKPFGAMSELWRASGPSADPSSWRAGRAWSVIGFWWAAYLAGNTISSVGGLQRTGTDLDSIIAGDYIILLGRAVSTVAAILAIVIVRSVVERQERALVLVTPANPVGRGSPASAVPSRAMPPRPD